MVNNFRQKISPLQGISINETLQKHWRLLLGLGIALVILGTLSIFIAVLTTLVSIITLGVFLLISGSALIYQAFKVWWHHWTKFFFQLGIAVLYVLSGLIFICFPVVGAIYLTLMLAIFYLISGVYRGVIALQHRASGWGWMLFSGLLAILIGVLILFFWPAISLWIIGIFIGIDIMFIGWALIMAALSAKEKITV